VLLHPADSTPARVGPPLPRAGAIRAADPNATIVAAGLAPAASSGGDLAPLDFLSGLYAAGARGAFDAVAFHPYTFPALPNATDGSAYWWGAMARLRDVMVANGDAAKQIWPTEYGAPTGGPPGSGRVPEAAQAAMASAAYGLAAGLPWCGPMFWYDLNDSGTSTDTAENFFGLVRFDGSRKPAYAAYQAVPAF
jgi:polysaccharide biosynthesis protein PslG